MHRLIRGLFVLFVTALLLAQPQRSAHSQPRPLAASADEVTLARTGNLGQSIWGATSQGDYVYAIQGGHAFVVYDISDGQRMVRVASVALQANTFVIDDTFAYVVGNGGLSVVDIGTPSNPHVVAYYDQPRGAYGVTLGDGYLYVSTSSTMHILRMASAVDLVEVAVYAVEADHFVSVEAVNGQYVYISVSKTYALPNVKTRLEVLDVGDPSAPVKVGSFPITGTYSAEFASMGSSVIIGRYLYALIYENVVPYGYLTLHTYDLTDPTIPQLVDKESVDTDASGGLFVDGTNLYFAGRAHHRQSPPYEYMSTFDLTDPAAPTRLGSEILSSDAAGIMIRGDTLYVITRHVGIDRVNIADPAHPVGTYGFPLLGDVHDIVVRGRYAFVASTDSRTMLQVLDISEAEQPETVATLELANPKPFGFGFEPITLRLTISGDFAYVTTVAGNDDQYAEVEYLDTHIIDIHDPRHPVKVSKTSLFDAEAHAVGQYMYSFGHDGTRIFDIKNPSAPREVGQVEAVKNVTSFVVANQTGYALSDQLLQILDVREPAQPQVVGSFEAPSGEVFSDVMVVGSYAYVAIEQGGMLILDIRNAASPHLVGSIETPTTAKIEQIRVSGGRAFLTSNYAVWIVDITDRAAPRAVGSYAVPSTGEIEVAAQKVYLNHFGGLGIYTMMPTKNRVFLPQLHRSGRALR